MTTNQEGRQAAVRTETTTTEPLSGDWHALFDSVPIDAGTWNERMLAWINDRLGESYTSLPGAMAAFAADGGFARWSDMNTVDIAEDVITGPGASTGEGQGLLLALTAS